MSSRFFPLVLLIYIQILLALATLDGGLIILTLPLMIYLGAGVLFGPAELRLRVERTLSSQRVMVEQVVSVEIIVTNEGAALEEVLIEEGFPEGLERVSGELSSLTSLAAGDSVRLAYSVRGGRGFYSFDTVKVVAREHLGLIDRRRFFSAPDRLFVMPRVSKINRVALRPFQTRVYAGNVPSRLGGPGVEFYGVRSYRPGDPMRWVNWRASARHPNEMFSNEFEQMRVVDVGLILDVRERSDVVTPQGSLFEHSVMAAAALGDALLADGNRVGLLLYGGVLNWTLPGYGKLQRERILRALSRATTDRSMVFERLEHLPTRLFPAHSQLVLISPLLREDLEPLIELRARGYQVLVISPNPVIFETQSLASSSSVILASRMALLERRLLLRELQYAGIRSLDWEVDIPFSQAMQTGLSRRPPRINVLRGIL